MCDQWVSDLLKDLPVVIISLIIGSMFIWTTYQQMAATKAKLKFDLFEKRHYVFVATWTYLSDLARKTPVTTTDIFNFSTNTASAKFLFGNDIVQFLEEAKLKGIQLGTAEHTMAWPQSEKAHNDASADRVAVVNWVEKELPLVKDRFKPYLDLSSW